MSTKGVGGGAPLKQTYIATWVLQAFLLCLIDDIVCLLQIYHRYRILRRAIERNSFEVFASGGWVQS